MSLKIPEDHKKWVKLLVTMESGQRQALLEALKVAEPTIGFVALGKELSEKLGGDRDELEGVLMMVGSLYWARIYRDMQIDEIVAAFRKNGEREGISPNPSWEAVTADLVAILNCDKSVGVTSKALHLYLSTERQFCDAEILTDIRPVFGPDVAEKPLGTVILHHLKLVYHDEAAHGRKAKEFFVSLERRDLEQLKMLVERALKKHASVKDLVSGIGLPGLEG